MSYAEYEESNELSRPIALYKLQWGNTVWRYTSADRDIPLNEVVDGVPSVVIYESVACSDSGMTQGGNSNSDFVVTVPSNLPIVALFRGTSPSGTIYLTVRRKNWQDPEAPVYWIGTVSNVRRPNDVSAQIVGDTMMSSFKRTGLRLSWQSSCPHILYDHSCRADPEAHKVTGTIVAVDGTSVTMDLAFESDEERFVGGFVRWTVNADGTQERRGIESVGALGSARFFLYGRTDRLAVGMELDFYPGCKHTPEACDNDFDNLPNYGGYQFIPGKSPFDGTPVF